MIILKRAALRRNECIRVLSKAYLTWEKGVTQCQSNLAILFYRRGEKKNMSNTCDVHSPVDRLRQTYSEDF